MNFLACVDFGLQVKIDRTISLSCSIAFLAVLTSVTCRLQAQSIDSLKNELAQAKGSSSIASLLRQLGEAYLLQKDTLAIGYFQELVTVSREQGDAHAAAEAFYWMGVVWYYQSNLIRSSNEYFHGLQESKQRKDFSEIKAKLHNGIGWNQGLTGNYPDALRHYQEAKTLFTNFENDQLKALVLNNMGVAYRNLEKYDSAAAFFQQSLAINRKINNQRQVRFNLNNIGSVLLNTHRHAEARKFLDEALQLNWQADDSVEIANNLLNLALIDMAKAEFGATKKKLAEVLMLATATKQYEQKRRAYNALIDLSKRSNDFQQAFRYQELYYKLTDSLYRKSVISQTNELEAKYRSLEKDRSLKEAKAVALQQRLYFLLVGCGLLATTIVIIFMSRLIQLKKANERRLIALNEKIEKQAQDLQQSYEEISGLNDNLEALVKQRTAVIESQNQRLREFVFFNSHKIRGPLASLLGLVSLLRQEPLSTENSKQLIAYLEESAIKLDDVVREVGQQLDNEQAGTSKI